MGIYEELENNAIMFNGVSTSKAGFIGVPADVPTGITKPVPISNFNEYESYFGGYSDAYLAYAVQSFFDNGGQSCYIMPVVEISPDWVAYALEAFEKIEDISIVAIPGRQVDEVYIQLVAHCEKLANRFAILDAGLDENMLSQLARYHDMIDSSYCAIYHPWIQVFSILEKKSIFIPPSGAIAGIYARVDAARGVWKAPANELIRACTNLSLKINEMEQNELSRIRINPIRVINSGIRVWGARTLCTSAGMKYINTRRLLIYVQESIKYNLSWTAFETNNEALWFRVKLTIDTFLTMLWHKGALAGFSPDEAYFVSIGKGITMTDDDISKGKLIYNIGIATTKPAEFTIFKSVAVTAEKQG